VVPPITFFVPAIVVYDILAIGFEEDCMRSRGHCNLRTRRIKETKFLKATVILLHY